MANKIVRPDEAICGQCGKPLQLEEFNKTYSSLYTTTNRLPTCKKCLSKQFAEYLTIYRSMRKAIQRICIAYDLYYQDRLFERCQDKSDESTILGNYLKALNMKQNIGKTFDNSLQEGFSFTDAKFVQGEESNISPNDVERWGGGLSPDDYEVLNSHYSLLDKANPQRDSNMDIFIDDLCYTKMLQMKALREARVDDYNKLTESYRKSFQTAGLKTTRETVSEEDKIVGVNIETIEKYTPAEYYKNKKLYNDHDGLSDYFERFLLRPLRNLQFGTKDRDYEFYVKDEEDGEEFDED